MAEHWEPRSHQKSMVKWLIQHPEAALFADPGLGKTSAAASAFQYLQRAKGVRKALVIAPLRVAFMVWTHDEGGELSKWSNFKTITTTLLHGSLKDERLNDDVDLYIINPAGLKWLIESGGLAQLLKRGVDTLIVDELSKLKHPKTQLFKMLKPFLPRFKRRWGLTGSPASNGLLDLFGQVYALDLGKRLGKFITHYRHQYFLPTGYKGYVWKPQEGAEDRIYYQLRDLAQSMRAEDHLDLPDLIEQNIWVDLPPPVRRAYVTLEADLIAQLEDRTVTAANAAVASGKCRQVASGGIYASEIVDLDVPGLTRTKRETIHLHDEKTNALSDLVDELQGTPLLIVYEFQHDLERIRKALGDVPAINGQTSAREGQQLANAWNKGELPLLAGHPAAMGHGLNLQGFGSHIAFYSLTWNFELYDQTVRRVYRAGQKAKRVIVHRILARNTVDADIAQVLESKERTQSQLLDALKTRVSKKVSRAAFAL